MVNSNTTSSGGSNTNHASTSLYDNIKEAKLQPFSGNKKDWRTWKMKHLAMAETRQYKEILTGSMKVP
jgi:hypothetical protein